MTNNLTSQPMLRKTLSIVLPSMEQTWLLQACLWSGTPGERAWEKWSGSIGDPVDLLREDTAGVKGLLPLLFHSLERKDVSIDKEFYTYLRTAYLRDELRSKAYSQICREVTSNLEGAGILTMVLKGAALAETAYPTPVLQHAHYLDILIRNDELLRAADLLSASGFVRSGEPIGSQGQPAELTHESRLPLLLHRQLFSVPFFQTSMEDIWSRSRNHSVSGGSMRILSPADNLLHVCGAVFDGKQHEALRWVCDAWFIVNRYPDLDWDLLVESARQSDIALPLFVTLGYLADTLRVPVPPSVLTRLADVATKTDRIAGEAALLSVQSSGRGGLTKILRSCGDWRTLAFVTQWALFPSPRYLRSIHQIRCAWLLPFYYPYRPLKFIVRQIWFFCRRHIYPRSRNLREVATTKSYVIT